MKKRVKIFLGIIGFLLVVIAILYMVFLKPSYIDEPMLKGVLHEETVISNGKTRSFHWYKPNTKTNNSISVLFVLHGSKSDGLTVRKQMGYEFDVLADKEGFIVVYPDGYSNHWNDCRASGDYKANTENIDDVSFLKAIEKKISDELNSTFKNRFAAGFSLGGHFSYKLALENPDWISAIAVVSANMPIDANLDCKKEGKFVPILLMNGTKDKINPYNGGVVSFMGNTSRGEVLSTKQTIAYWTTLGKCNSEPQRMILDDYNTNDDSTVEKTTWSCNGKERVSLFKIENGGHAIPHPENAGAGLLGTTNKDINAPQIIWQFFDSVKE